MTTQALTFGGILSSIAAAVRGELRRWPVSLKIGSVVVGVVALAGIFAPWLAPYDPYYQDFTATLQPPSLAHPFGTDMVGRDIFSRAIHGARIDLRIGLITTYVPMIYGVALGAIAGYYGGRFDAFLMRALDIAIAFPFIVLIIVILSILGPGVQNIYIAVFLVAWTMYARLARGDMLVERRKEYILAAKTLGFGPGRIIFRHALPNIISSSIVFSMSDFVLNILLVSGLSFLGLGIQPPAPEWGAMVAEGRDYITQAWWISTMPGLVIVVTGIGFSLIGDGLSRRLGQEGKGVGG